MHLFQKPDTEKVLTLLAQNNLPVDDLGKNSFEHFFGCGSEEAPGGIIGVEFFKGIGLLRSLAVKPDCRGRGCGQALVEQIENYSFSKGLHTLYLITETAEPFFSKLGYQVVERSKVPNEIRQTAEFTSLCSAEAVVMNKRLGDPPMPTHDEGEL